MKIIDVIEPERINKTPDKTITLLSSGNYMEEGFEVKNVSLNLYTQKIDAELGTYSVITALIQTNKGEIEITYDEGYHDEKDFERIANFLMSYLGISSLILRSVIQLKNTLQIRQKS